ncbi:MAG: hypothetical protein PHS57_01170 [Alphaproteobacteria bacterium]|nr:hypothetical protein [Alphaproteobacteria bacterium]
MSTKEPNDPKIALLVSITKASKNSISPDLLNKIQAGATLEEKALLDLDELMFGNAEYDLTLLSTAKNMGHNVPQEALDGSRIDVLIRMIKLMDDMLAIAARVGPLEDVAKSLDVRHIDLDSGALTGRKLLETIKAPNVIALFDAAFELQRKEAENAKNVAPVVSATEKPGRMDTQPAPQQKQPTP